MRGCTATRYAWTREPGRGEAAQPALDLHRHRLVGDDDAVALADGALAGQDLARPVGDVLARHLDEPER